VTIEAAIALVVAVVVAVVVEVAIAVEGRAPRCSLDRFADPFR
jgi:hypothetical protein